MSPLRPRKPGCRPRTRQTADEQHADALRTLIARDTARLQLLRLVRALGLPDCWIAAGFVRSAAWDALHARAPSLPQGDVDVIWFDPLRIEREVDATIEASLTSQCASVVWSVKNQARMHLRNGDAPYHGSCDAMRFWPETATAVAVRLTDDDDLEFAAPFGLADLMTGVLRPTPLFIEAKRHVFDARVRTKRWIERWPGVRIIATAEA